MSLFRAFGPENMLDQIASSFITKDKNSVAIRPQERENMDRISLRNENHFHTCRYGTYCRGEVIDVCRPPTSDQQAALDAAARVGWRFEHQERFCERQADANGNVRDEACTLCRDHYYS